MTTLIAVLIPGLLGFLCITVLLRHDPSTRTLERLCLAFPLGMGIISMQMFVLGIFGVPLTLKFVMIPIGLEIMVLCVWIVKNHTRLVEAPAFELFREIGNAGSLLKRVSMIVLLSWLSLKLGSIFMETFLRPIFAWDSFANWAGSAKVFYYTKGLLLDVPLEEFFGKGLLNRNTNYPPHNPLTQVWFALWIGQFDEVLVKLSTPVYFLCMVVYLYLVAARETTRFLSLAIMVIFLGSPLMCFHAIEVYSDVPLSALILLSLGSFLLGIRGRNVYWALTGIFSAEALFMKDEGMFFVLPLLFSGSLFLWHKRQEIDRPLRSFFLMMIPFAYIIPWFVFKFKHELGFGADYVTLNLTFRPDMIWRIFLLFASFRNFNVFFVLFPVLLILAGRPTREFLHLFLPVVCYALFFVMLYSMTKFFSGELMFYTAVHRNTLTYYPAACLLMVFLIKRFGYSKSHASKDQS